MLYQSILIPHITAGIISIILFWVPAFTKKGGRIHVLSGKIYVYAMWVVVFSSAVLCVISIAQERYTTAIFLGFLSMLTTKPLWLGRSILKKPDVRFWYIKKYLEIVIFLGGLGLFILGIITWGTSASILFMIFGILGLINLPDIRLSIKHQYRDNRIQTHMAEMIISGIAAYTAFLAFGASQFLETFLSGSWTVLPWILPTVIGVLAIRILRSRYQNKKASLSQA